MEWVYPHIETLRRLLRKRGQSRHDTEDLMQDLFVRVWTKHRSGEDIRDPEAFLAQVARNLATSAYKKKHEELYECEPVDAVCVEDPNSLPEELVWQDQCLERLQSTLNQLEERTRNAYLLHRLHGLTYEQIGEQLDMTVRTVENHIARAMDALFREMQRT